MLFITMMIVVFVLFSKNITIAYNSVVSVDKRVQTASYFGAFLVLCIVLWAAFKYAYAVIAFMCVLIVGAYSIMKYGPGKVKDAIGKET